MISGMPETVETPEKVRFLAELAKRGNVRDACKAARIARATPYRWREADPDFAAAWRDALDQAADVLEREAFRRAVTGVQEPVFGSLGPGQGTGEVGAVRKYSDTLLIFLLKGARPEKYRERVDNRIDGTVNHLHTFTQALETAYTDDDPESTTDHPA